ncbi:hypothetical protein [Sphingopyxis indica]|uniref:hypothetical protein n=1 Tax=Sphingopyxis indica TaxID=436663 RepID=UPI00148277D1|nr:hypothetical protein [Sphingopyxis indica]
MRTNFLHRKEISGIVAPEGFAVEGRYLRLMTASQTRETSSPTAPRTIGDA